jgi:hypothetical protein
VQTRATPLANDKLVNETSARSAVLGRPG